MPSLYAEIMEGQDSPRDPGTIPGTDTLRPAFRTRVERVARRLKMDPQHLLRVMSFETGGTFDPAVRNKAGSGATGLIQFMPQTAQRLGTTTDDLARMSPEEQLDYVERYLRPYAGQMRTQQDAYMAVLYPAALGKPEGHVLFHKGTRAYEQNKGLDPGQTGQVTIGDTMRTVGRFVRGALTPASAEAAPVSPARTPSGGAGRSFYSDIVAPAPPATAPAPASGGTSLYGPMSVPAPPPSLAPASSPAPAPAQVPAAQTQPPQSLQPTPAPQDYRSIAAQELARLQQEETARLTNWKIPAATGISAGSAMLGTAAGTLVAPLTGPLAPAMPLVGEMAGSYLGRQLNVGLGLEEPGTAGDVASIALPPLMQGVTRAVPAGTRAVIRKLPGASTAMHQEVAERLSTMKDRLQPPIPASDLYAAAAGYNPPITASAVNRTATAVLAEEMALQPSVRNPRLVRVARDLQTLTQADVPMEQLYAHQQRVGELVRDFRSKGGVGEGRIKQLYAAFHADLETAAGKGVAGARELKDAIAASRKEHVAAEIDDLFQPGKSGITIDPEGRASINGGRLASAWKAKLRRDTVLDSTLSSQEKAEMEAIITLAQRLERLRPPKGVQFGSGRALARGAVATGIAAATGMNPLMVGAVAMNAPELIGKAMQTAAGRALVKKALQDGRGTIDPLALAAMAALVRQQAGAPPEATSVTVTPPGPGGTYQGP